MRKSRAFLIHLALSGAVAATALVVFVRLWYPLPYFVADGGWQGLRLVALVDVVLGPLLTLVVYRRSKPRRALFFDYTCIGAVQLAALLLGLWTIYEQRTEIVTFADGRFYTVDAQTAAALGAQADAVLAGSGSRPAYAMVRMPDTEDARQELRKESVRTRRPLYLRGDLYAPLDRTALARIAAEYPWSPAADGVEAPASLVNLRSSDGRTPLLLPVACRYRNVVLAFAPGSASLLDWAPLPETVGKREVHVGAGGR